MARTGRGPQFAEAAELPVEREHPSGLLRRASLANEQERLMGIPVLAVGEWVTASTRPRRT